MLIQVSTLAMLNFLFSFVQIDARDIPDGVMPKKNYNNVRRAAGTGGGGGGSSSTSPTTNKNDQSSTQQASSSQSSTGGGAGGKSDSGGSTSTTVPTTVAVTTTKADGSTVTSHVSTQTAVATSDKSSTQQTSLVKVGSTTINAATLSHKTVVSDALVTKHTEQSTFTSYWTTHGTVHSSLVTTAVVEASTTGYAKTTVAPALADGGGSGQNLTTHTKAIVGGVVGGIGGAILIGGLAFVAWRLWGKKRGVEDDDSDNFGKAYNSSSYQGPGMTFNNNTAAASEPYSNPGGQVNTASNF